MRTLGLRHHDTGVGGSAGRVAGEQMAGNAVAVEAICKAGIGLDDLHAGALALPVERQMPHREPFTADGSADLVFCLRYNYTHHAGESAQRTGNITYSHLSIGTLAKMAAESILMVRCDTSRPFPS